MRHFPKSFTTGIVIAGLSALLSACGALKATPYPTPGILYYGSTPTVPESDLPGSLDCSRVPGGDIRRGPTWREIRIGVSTLDDMQAQLAIREMYWHYPRGHLKIKSQAPSEDSEWFSLQTCFAQDGTLSALNIRNRDIFRMLDDWVTEYGPPDRVTWGADYYSRSLIWAEAGMLAVVDAEFQSTVRLILFSPIPRDQLEDSWLMAGLPHWPDATPGGDLPSLPPEIARKRDPWNIEREP